MNPLQTADKVPQSLQLNLPGCMLMFKAYSGHEMFSQPKFPQAVCISNVKNSAV